MKEMVAAAVDADVVVVAAAAAAIVDSAVA